jgi:hypothetical protein
VGLSRVLDGPWCLAAAPTASVFPTLHEMPLNLLTPNILLSLARQEVLTIAFDFISHQEKAANEKFNQRRAAKVS